MLRKKGKYITLSPNKLGKKLFHFFLFLFYSYITFWSLWLYLYSHIVDLYFLSISRISLEYHYDYIITISHCTFFYQEIRLNGRKFKSFEKSDKEEYRYASRDKGLLSESLLCRPRMSPAENKRLEVHACFPLTAHCSFFLLHLNSYFLPISLLRHPWNHSSFSLTLSLCFTISLFFSFMFIITLPFSFLVLRQRSFRCCAAFRQSTSSIYAVGLLPW